MIQGQNHFDEEAQGFQDISWRIEKYDAKSAVMLKSAVSLNTTQFYVTLQIPSF